MRAKLIIAAILALALTLFLVHYKISCVPTGMSEEHVNFIDDDCDLLVDEDFVPSECGNGIVERFEYCDDGNTENLDGCSSDCKIESDRTIYVTPYMGNIDGDFSDNWYHFYDMIIEFHDRNAIPSGFSIYPASIHEGPFADRFARMYRSKYIEFVQKSFTGNEIDRNMDKLSFEEQKMIIKAGQDYFREIASRILGTESVSVPVAYNQPQGRLTESIRDALRELGFRIFFDMYVTEVGPVRSTPDFDVVQYGAGFTKSGDSGRRTVFRSPEEIISDIKNYSREDVYMLYVNGRKVVPVWVHHSDFEDALADNVINETKWKMYTKTMLMLKEDPDIVILTPSQLYEARRVSK